MDPISLLLLAQSTVAAIKRGTEMLAQGKAEIDSFKRNVEKGIGDARAIYKEVTGIWGWLTGLFRAQPKAPVAVPDAAKPEAEQSRPKAKKAAHEPELSYEEYQTRAIHQVCEQLKQFFEIQRKLKEHCRELEEISKTTETIEDSAIDRVEIELQLEQMTVQIREAMVYAPAELRNIYSRFLQMYEQIIEEQEFAREVKRKKDRDDKWQRELLRHHRIDRAVVGVTAVLAILWMWAVLLSFGWLAKTPAGLSSLL